MDNYDSVVQLYNSTSSWMGIKVSSEKIHELMLINLKDYLIQNDSRVTLGAFAGEKLILSMGIYFWNSLPACTFNRFIGQTEDLPILKQSEVLKNLMNMAIEEMEKREIFRFFVLTSLRHQKALALFNKTSEKLKNRYLLVVEEQIKANQMPKYEYVWQIMDKNTWPVDLVLRSGTAMNHVRNLI